MVAAWSFEVAEYSPEESGGADWMVQGVNNRYVRRNPNRVAHLLRLGQLCFSKNLSSTSSDSWMRMRSEHRQHVYLKLL